MVNLIIRVDRRYEAQVNHNNAIIDDIAHLQDRIGDVPFRNQVEILETEVAEVRENVNALATAITLLQNRMGLVENQSQGLQTQVNGHQILSARIQVDLQGVVHLQRLNQGEHRVFCCCNYY